MPTEKGICSVFNGVSLRSSVKFDSGWAVALQRYFKPSGLEDNQLHMVPGAGLGRAIRFILDLHQR